MRYCQKDGCGKETNNWLYNYCHTHRKEVQAFYEAKVFGDDEEE